MSETDDFVLTRPDHQRSLVGSIEEETEFHDVSLACEDKQLRAHKVVLAASSPKLRSILLSHPHPNPLIYLSGVRFSLLEKLLQFIYTGQVAVSPDQLDSFLAVAQELQVKDLTPAGGGHSGGEVSTTNTSRNREDMEDLQEVSEGTKVARRDRGPPAVREQSRSHEDVEKIEEKEEDENSNSVSASYYHDQLPHGEEDEVVRPVLENNTVGITEVEKELQKDIAEDYAEYEDRDYLSLPEAVGKNKGCPYCQKIISYSNLMRHVRAIHYGEKPHQCPHCNKTFSQKVKLARHIKAKHRD